ncbi:hypothetical protein HETIRDRAFT_456138 [Heterobasidion irregulare TC 32-1]|uniref:Uncharacterized protein n=1 Tax=Heterobasidion irregulare (strain TC 32-1) TaxID=747525 RepID=W4JR53_HETIT|nr:uncharacterized protein HETIRDRAFT_456138 [Heterobasidion irregulare TC 32-1]ETW75570.1 hypothetical protein HETIRDRAFT_456138 [Heterobasidion irregulare TC 32-1]
MKLTSEAPRAIKLEVPKNGNDSKPQSQWTTKEKKVLDTHLKAFVRWEVNYEEAAVRATVCKRLTENWSGICNACSRIAKDESLKDAVYRKECEAQLSRDEQHKINLLRDKYAPTTFRSIEDRALQGLLKDPMLSNLFYHAERDDSASCSLQLYKTLVSNSKDVLQNPDLVFENIARVKRFADHRQYTGPIAFAGDCTKVRPRLAYSSHFGGYILGSTLPLDECKIKHSDDIDRLVQRAKAEKAIASQVRVIMSKLPLPDAPPLAVAMLSTTGKDNSRQIHNHHMLILQMAAQLDMKVISFAADGTALELAALSLMDAESSPIPPVIYDHPASGFSHGTHTASLGVGYLVNRSLVELYETGNGGLVQSDVKNVDKKDDGAARRLFHHNALHATTYCDPANGELIDAWINRKLDIESHLQGAFRARFFLRIWRSHIVHLTKKYPDLYSTTRSFISPPCFKILNRLCDSLIALAIVYAEYYPHIPFCPWLLSTEFVEHFFGLARTMLPNFTFSQLLALVKHVMLRQQILLSGQFNEKKERTFRAGYIFDFDNSPLTPKELTQACSRITR